MENLCENIDQPWISWQMIGQPITKDPLTNYQPITERNFHSSPAMQLQHELVQHQPRRKCWASSLIREGHPAVVALAQSKSAAVVQIATPPFTIVAVNQAW